MKNKNVSCFILHLKGKIHVMWSNWINTHSPLVPFQARELIMVAKPKGSEKVLEYVYITLYL